MTTTVSEDQWGYPVIEDDGLPTTGTYRVTVGGAPTGVVLSFTYQATGIELTAILSPAAAREVAAAMITMADDLGRRRS